jgi:hypothetical protein
VAFNANAKVVYTLPELDALSEQYHQEVRVENVNGTLAVVQDVTHVGTLDGQVLVDLLRATDDDDNEPPVSEGTEKLCNRDRSMGRCVRKRCLTRLV